MTTATRKALFCLSLIAPDYKADHLMPRIGTLVDEWNVARAQGTQGAIEGEWGCAPVKGKWNVTKILFTGTADVPTQVGNDWTSLKMDLRDLAHFLMKSIAPLSTGWAGNVVIALDPDTVDNFEFQPVKMSS